MVCVTLDSCRYDVARDARLPSLSMLSPLVKAETAGTYTLPAHMAFFSGFLPVPLAGRIRIGKAEVDAVWRSAAARPVPVRVAVPFAARTIMEHYQQKGFRVLGAGGVTFFDAGNPLNMLPSLFPEFRYYGRPTRVPGTGERPRLGPTDRSGTLALSHVGELAGFCGQAGRYFLFVNCACTHIPYTTPASALTPELERLLDRLYRLHELKTATAEAPGLTGDERGLLLGMQRQALEWADGQLGILFDQIRGSGPLVVACADHGEEFGEGGRYGHAHCHETVTTVPMWCGLLT